MKEGRGISPSPLFYFLSLTFLAITGRMCLIMNLAL